MEATIREYAKCLEGPIDYAGQEKAEKIVNKVLLLVSVCGVVLGVLYQDMRYTIYSFGFGVAVCCLLVVPPYKMYKQHNLVWLPSPGMDMNSVDVCLSNGNAAQVVLS